MLHHVKSSCSFEHGTNAQLIAQEDTYSESMTSSVGSQHSITANGGVGARIGLFKNFGNQSQISTKTSEKVSCSYLILFAENVKLKNLEDKHNGYETSASGTFAGKFLNGKFEARNRLIAWLTACTNDLSTFESGDFLHFDMSAKEYKLHD